MNKNTLILMKNKIVHIYRCKKFIQSFTHCINELDEFLNVLVNTLQGSVKFTIDDDVTNLIKYTLPQIINKIDLFIFYLKITQYTYGQSCDNTIFITSLKRIFSFSRYFLFIADNNLLILLLYFTSCLKQYFLT